MQIRSLPPLAWFALVAPAGAFLLLSSRGPLARPSLVAPELAFWLIVIVTALCAVGAIVVLAMGWRRRLAEMAILGSSLFVASVLPMVHGLTLPGVLYGPNPATMASAFLAVPLGLLAASPLLVPEPALGRTLAARWRAWSLLAVSGSLVLAVLLLADPNLIAAPRIGAPLTYAAILISLAGGFVLSARQLRLYRIGRRGASLAASIGFAYLGLSTLVFVIEEPFGLGWWGAHLLDAAGVLAAIAGLALAHARDRSLASVLAPVTNRDPLIALELGLTPVVHRFIAALERRDEVTRDHVVRVGELSMRVGVRAGIDGSRLRALGIGALLHDVGKLLVPDRILKKPGGLSYQEFERIKRHCVLGAELMETSPLLAPAAGLVRWHHERADGSGYPDGIPATELPVEAGIISACDGWDAMTSLRPYRDAMSAADAREIMLEGAGSQWTATAVALLLDEIDEHGSVASPVYDEVGRARARSAAARGEAPLEVCPEALPATLRPRVPV